VGKKKSMSWLAGEKERVKKIAKFLRKREKKSIYLQYKTLWASEHRKNPIFVILSVIVKMSLHIFHFRELISVTNVFFLGVFKTNNIKYMTHCVHLQLGKIVTHHRLYTSTFSLLVIKF
jgi:hypothetical protein